MADADEKSESACSDDKRASSTPDQNVSPTSESGGQSASSSNRHGASDDLDDLLESALADFDKTPLPAATADASGTDKDSQDGTKQKTKGKKQTKSKSKSQEAAFNEAFNEAELASAAQEAMKAFSSEDPQMFEQFQKLMAESAGGDSSENDDKFLESLKETMKAMSDNAHNVQTEDLGDDDLVKALSDLGLDMNDTEDDRFEPIIENMMKSLLSKDVLYPSMYNMNKVYPSWLEENETKLSTEQFDTYCKQYNLIKEICEQFEAEKKEDTEEVRKRRFDKIYALMQEMQDCGQPPPEIVKELAPGMTLDESGIPRIAGMDQQCCVM